MLNAIFLGSLIMMLPLIAGMAMSIFQANMRVGEAEDRAYKRFTFFAGAFSAAFVAAAVSGFILYVL